MSEFQRPVWALPGSSESCPPGYFTSIGTASGVAGGVMLATACTAGSGGICALGAPAIVAGMTSLGTSVGAAGDAIAQNSDAIALGMGKVDKWIRRIIAGIGIGAGQGMTEEQQRVRDNKPREEQVQDDKTKKKPGGSPPPDPDE